MNTKWVLFLICGLLISLNVSQSLLDVFEGLIFVTTILIVFKLKTNVFKFIPKPVLLVLISLFVVTALGYALRVDEFNDLKIKGLLEYRWSIIFLCTIILLHQLEWSKKNLIILLYSFSTATFLNFIYYFIYGAERAGGLFRNPMFYAQNLAPLLLVLLNIYFFIFLNKNKLSSIGLETEKSSDDLLRTKLKNTKFLIWVVLANIVVGSVLLLLTQTRGVWIGFFIAGFVNLFFLKKELVFKLIGIVTVAVIVILAASPTMRSRIAMNSGSQGYSKTTRLLFWKANIDLFKEKPFFGVGYGINNELYFDRLTEDEKAVIMVEPNLQRAHAHNQYIQYLAGTGVLGLMSYLALVFSILFYSYKAIRLSSSALSFERFLAVGIFVGLICFLVSGLTESNFSISKTRSLFLFLSAAGIVLYNRSIKHELK